MAGIPVCIPVCIECGTHDNPCRCKVVGPTLGFVAFCLAAVVEWPVGALVWCFNHKKGSDIMAQPVARLMKHIGYRNWDRDGVSIGVGNGWVLDT